MPRQFYQQVKQVPHEGEILSQLPPQLRVRLLLVIHERLLTVRTHHAARSWLSRAPPHSAGLSCAASCALQVPLFRRTERSLVCAMVEKMKPMISMPGEAILLVRTLPSGIFVLTTGACDLVDAEGEVVGQLRDGDFFGDELLDGKPMRATVRSTGYCNLMVLLSAASPSFATSSTGAAASSRASSPSAPWLPAGAAAPVARPVPAGSRRPCTACVSASVRRRSSAWGGRARPTPRRRPRRGQKGATTEDHSTLSAPLGRRASICECVCVMRRLHSHHGLKCAYPFKLEEGGGPLHLPGAEEGPGPTSLSVGVRDAELIEHR